MIHMFGGVLSLAVLQYNDIVHVSGGFIPSSLDAYAYLGILIPGLQILTSMHVELKRCGSITISVNSLR